MKQSADFFSRLATAMRNLETIRSTGLELGGNTGIEVWWEGLPVGKLIWDDSGIGFVPASNEVVDFWSVEAYIAEGMTLAAIRELRNIARGRGGDIYLNDAKNAVDLKCKSDRLQAYSRLANCIATG